jgi:hypothetical protein
MAKKGLQLPMGELFQPCPSFAACPAQAPGGLPRGNAKAVSGHTRARAPCHREPQGLCLGGHHPTTPPQRAYGRSAHGSAARASFRGDGHTPPCRLARTSQITYLALDRASLIEGEPRNARRAQVSI